MPCYCATSDQDDHVWRWRNELAGYHTFARRHWSKIPTRYGTWIDINALDAIDPVHCRARLADDQFDDNQEAITNGDCSVY